MLPAPRPPGGLPGHRRRAGAGMTAELLPDWDGDAGACGVVIPRGGGSG